MRRTALLILFAIALMALLASALQAATIVVPAGGDLQAAMNSAQPGDSIVVQAGADYIAPSKGFVFPVTSGSSYITITSSRASEIVGRAGPSQASLMARIRSNVPSEPVFLTKPASHHWRLVGLDIAPATGGQAFTIIKLGSSWADQDISEEVPHHFDVDRNWIHGAIDQEVQRGIALNSAFTNITNNTVDDIHGIGYDTQAICGWNGPGPFNIINNRLEASGENIMFGGADATIAGLTPSDITIAQNYVFKPLSWKVGDPSFAGRHWTVKNLLETKNARRVKVDGNLFENCWPDAQVGFAILLKSNNQESTNPWAVTEDLDFTNNTVKNTEHGLNILGVEYPPKVSGITKRIRILNNVWEVQKIWLQIIRGGEDLQFEHNTFLTAQTAAESTSISFDELPVKGFALRNNLGSKTVYGIKGSGSAEGTATLNQWCPGWIDERNVLASFDPNSYPTNNFYPATLAEVKLGADYRLAVDSPYKGKATDGTDPGVDMDALLAAQSGGPAVPLPNPSPSPVPSASPSPTPSPAPTPAPTPVPCTTSINAPVLSQWSSGKLVVTFTGLTSPANVTVTPTTGQLTVLPSSRQVSGTSMIAEFLLQSKKKSSSVVVSGPCGSQTVPVIVK